MKGKYILIAEDDADDIFLLRSAFAENTFDTQLHFVENGVELVEFLHNAKNSSANSVALPEFILLDLNMPKKDGRDVLKELKGDDFFAAIPMVVFSTTNNENEIKRCFDLGADSYITKPNSFEGLIRIVADLNTKYCNFQSNT